MSKSVRTGIALAVMCAGVLGVAAPQASADDLSKRELLNKCGSETDYCHFHPSGKPITIPGKMHQVGKVARNCGTTPADYQVNWSETVGESNSYGVSLSAEGGFAGVFTVSVETSFNYTWETSHTFGENTTIHLKPGQKGVVKLSSTKKKVKGTYEMHFGEEVDGHYVHYVDFTAVGPTRNDKGTIITDTKQMSNDEYKKFCG